VSNKKIYLIISGAFMVVIAGVALFFALSGEKKEFQLVPRERPVADRGAASGAEVGTGWSYQENAADAVQEAAGMALRGKTQPHPDFAVIFASSGSDLPGILSEARKLLGKKIKIYGGTSDSRAVMTNKGYVRVIDKGDAPPPGKRGLAVMTVTSKDIVFGVGSADFTAYPSAQEASKAAMVMAIKSAGRSPREIPQAILITPTRGQEDEALEGIGEVVGKDALVLGGTAGGPKFGVLGEQEVFEKGISLAGIYTALPVGWVFEGGFDSIDTPSGIVTKMDGLAIVEIDHRPALDVYDEWLAGGIKKLFAEEDDYRRIRDLLTLHPLCRMYKSPTGKEYILFSHPWPKDKTYKDKSILTSTRIKQGEKIYLSHGTWETLINRVGNLPLIASNRGGLAPGKPPLLGIGYICAGVMGIIPLGERERMPLLINQANKDAPFIAPFTWGEQGHFPGIASKHGNLLTSFLLIGEKEK
jgi:hypothetical protein